MPSTYQLVAVSTGITKDIVNTFLETIKLLIKIILKITKKNYLHAYMQHYWTKQKTKMRCEDEGIVCHIEGACTNSLHYAQQFGSFMTDQKMHAYPTLNLLHLHGEVPLSERNERSLAEIIFMSSAAN